jgi:excisionase family DNA binding protein
VSERSTKDGRDSEQSERLTYDVPVAGRKLGLGKNASYEAARKGQIPTIRIGRRLLVPKAAFEEMLS